MSEPAPAARMPVAGEALDPRVLTLWRIDALVPALVTLVAGGGTAAVLSGIDSGPPAGLVLSVTVALVVVLTAGALVGASLTYRHWRYRVGEEGLELRHGVFVRTHSSIPYHRVQQIDVTAGPLDRALGLRTLVVRTASSTTDATIPGIAAERAEALRRRILERSGEGDAV